MQSEPEVRSVLSLGDLGQTSLSEINPEQGEYPLPLEDAMRVRAGKCQHSAPSIEGRPEEEATVTSQSTLQIIQGNTSPSKASPPGTQPRCPWPPQHLHFLLSVYSQELGKSRHSSRIN